MHSNPRTTVKITFRTPDREQINMSSMYHERQIEGVPRSVVHRMTKDFLRYKRGRDAADPNRLYQYEKRGEETLVALDFEEVVTLQAIEV